MIPRIVAISLIILAAAVAFALPKISFTDVVKNTQAYGQTPQVISAQNQTATESALPKRNETFTDAPETTAQAVVVIDEKTGNILYSKNPDLKHLPASTTKLMTALVALEKCSPDDIITVSALQRDGSVMGLNEGDKITVKDLLKGLLISSGNDAAFALAQNCAQSYDDFINKMNQKAHDLQMSNSHFANPAGYDDELQYSTADDLAKLARVATANPLIANIVKTKSTVVTDVSGLKTYYLENVNKLLGVVDGLDGVKTGETQGALENLISKTTRGGNSIIISVLGSKDRFGETQKLIEWAFANFTWK